MKYLFLICASLMFSSAASASGQIGERREISDLEDHVNKYCNMFLQIPYGSIASTMKEMETTQFPLSVYFSSAVCQSERYSPNVRSPLLHIIVDNPNSREKFLEYIYKYFLLIKRQPGEFTKAVNATNTKGETLLDYIETLKATKGTNYPEQLVVFQKFIRQVCSQGGRYVRYSSGDERCESALAEAP